MEAVIAHYAGWTHHDVSALKCGWDLTFRRNGDEEHVEVKGVSGQKPRILLTRNEHAIAQTDPAWRLLIVTRALVAPEVHEFGRDVVVQRAEPYVYVADLAPEH